LKQSGALSPQLFNITLEYGTLEIKGDKRGLTLNGVNQVLVYEKYVDLTENTVDALQK